MINNSVFEAREVFRAGPAGRSLVSNDLYFSPTGLPRLTDQTCNAGGEVSHKPYIPGLRVMTRPDTGGLILNAYDSRLYSACSDPLGSQLADQYDLHDFHFSLKRYRSECTGFV